MPKLTQPPLPPSPRAVGNNTEPGEPGQSAGGAGAGGGAGGAPAPLLPRYRVATPRDEGRAALCSVIVMEVIG